MGANDIDRLQWLQARRAGIGGSDIGAIIGLSKWKSPVDVWLDKTGRTEPDMEMSEPAYFGIELESFVAAEYSKRSGNKVQRVNQIIKHPQRAWMLANIDRAVVADGSRARVDKFGTMDGIKGLLECKTASAYLEREWSDGSAPLAYVAQCQWYMAVTGAEWCDLAVLIGGQKYVCHRIDRDESLIDAVIEAGRQFWFNNVIADLPPTPRTPEETLALFPTNSRDDLVVASDDIMHALGAYQLLKQQAKSVDDEMAVVKAAIQSFIGSHSGVCDPQGSPLATWKQSKPSQKTNWKDAAAEIKAELIEAGHDDLADIVRDIINKHTTEQPGARPLIIK
jgi:putative phage-type endonuclease